jgi:hypothetical protein
MNHWTTSRRGSADHNQIIINGAVTIGTIKSSASCIIIHLDRLCWLGLVAEEILDYPVEHPQVHRH